MKIVIIYLMINTWTYADCFVAGYGPDLVEINKRMSQSDVEGILKELYDEVKNGDVPKKGFKYAYSSTDGGKLFINSKGSDNPHHGELNAYCSRDTAGYIRVDKKKGRWRLEVDNKSILYCDQRYHGLSSLGPVVELLSLASEFYGDNLRIELENNKTNCP